MATTSRAELIDRLLDGKLAETMTGWRGDGLTYDEIAAAFRSEHDVKVSREWVRRWFDDHSPIEAAS